MNENISIVIPTRNRADLLARAVSSALKNCPSTGEIIVVDDKSIVPSSEALSHIRDSRLRIVRNSQPQSGASISRNLGVAHARNEIVFFLDDDDVFVDGYIDLVLGCTEFRLAAYGFGNMVQNNPFAARVRPFRLADRKGRLRRTLGGAGAGFWVRRDIFLEAGGFDPAHTVDEDTDLCVRLGIAGHSCLIYMGQATVTVLDESLRPRNYEKLTDNQKSKASLDCYRRTFEKAYPSITNDPDALWYLSARYVRRALRSNLPEEARSFCLSQQDLMLRALLLPFFYVKFFYYGLKYR